MSFDTVTLQCYLAVAETRSFTKAASRVGRTQSAVSQQIAKLENLLGTELFRRGKELSLTTNGEIFLGYAKRMFELHCESVDRFRTPELIGELRFGLPEDFAAMILSDVLVEFSRMHPRVVLNAECELTLNLLEKYHAGQFDLVLIKSSLEHAVSETIDAWTEPVDWIGKTDLLREWKKHTPIPLILSPAPCVYRKNVIDALQKYRLDWRLAYSSTSYAGKMAAVRAGLGITAIQRSLAPPDLDRIQLDFLPHLDDVKVSILKKSGSNAAVDSLAFYLLKKLRNSRF